MQMWKLCDKKWRHNDVITKNDGNQSENADLSLIKQNIFVQKVLIRFTQNVTLIKFKPLSQKVWAFISGFIMIIHQIWSCLVTLAAISKIFIFHLILY